MSNGNGKSAKPNDDHVEEIQSKSTVTTLKERLREITNDQVETLKSEGEWKIGVRLGRIENIYNQMKEGVTLENMDPAIAREIRILEAEIVYLRFEQATYAEKLREVEPVNEDLKFEERTAAD